MNLRDTTASLNVIDLRDPELALEAAVNAAEHYQTLADQFATLSVLMGCVLAAMTITTIWSLDT